MRNSEGFLMKNNSEKLRKEGACRLAQLLVSGPMIQNIMLDDRVYVSGRYGDDYSQDSITEFMDMDREIMIVEEMYDVYIYHVVRGNGYVAYLYVSNDESNWSHEIMTRIDNDTGDMVSAIIVSGVPRTCRKSIVEVYNHDGILYS